MDGRSTRFIKEAVFAVLKGHLTVDGAAEKYGIPEEHIKEGIKNYCLSGKITEERERSFIGKLYEKFLKMNLRNAFSRIAPTYDHEKALDRFKFKFAYATVSFMVVAFGIFIMNFPGAFNPPDMNAKSFEEKMDQALMATSKRPSTIDAEVKYLNRFYSRINKILDSSNAKESQALKAEIGNRLAYINKIDRAEVARKAVNFSDPSAAADRKPAAGMYKRMYSAASEKDENGYLAKAFKERADAETASGKASVYLAKAAPEAAVSAASQASPAAAPAAPVAVITATTQAEAEALLAAASEVKPEIEEPAAEEISAEDASPEAEAPAESANKSQIAKAAPAREEAAQAREDKAAVRAESAPVQETALAKTERAPAAEAAPAQTYKFAAKKYDSMKDRLFIINRYKKENLLKRIVARPTIKLKYPIASMLPVVDQKKYNESLKKIATNPKEVREVKIVEDRG